MPTFLVTGGCGFIGSHLCEALRASGNGVRVLDDLSTGVVSNLPEGVEFVRGDVADPDTVAHALSGTDGCFHLAAVASVAKGEQDWLGTHRTNLTGTIAVFDAVRHLPGGPIPVVYASSAAVYGDCPHLPIDEGAPTLPLSAYGADKLGCELHARAAGHVHGVATVGLRFFNVYGPRQDPNSPYSGVISIFCNRLRRGEPVDVHGDGEQTRDFVYVGDVAQTLLSAMFHCSAAAPIFNVCTGCAIPVSLLARTIAELCGLDPEIRFLPPRSGDIRHSVGSPARLRAVLRDAEPVQLRSGLAAVLGWMAA